jgi:hypothetical protein
MADPDQVEIAFAEAERECQACGRTFLVAKRRGRDAAFCTDLCRTGADRLRKARWRSGRAARSIIRRPTCQACRATFEQRGGGPLRLRCDACQPPPTEEDATP